MVNTNPKRRGYLSLGSGRAICQLCGEKIAKGVPQINHRASRCTASFHANAKDCGVPRSKKYIKEAGCSNCGMVLIAEKGNCLNCFTMNAENFEANGSGYFMETGGRMVSIDSDIEVNYNWDTDPSEIEDDYGEIQEKVEEKVRDEYYQGDSGSGYMREEYLDENNEYQDYEISYEWTKEVSDGAEEEIKSWAETDLSMNAESSNTKLLGIGAGILATIFYMYFQK